jgi:hypothetical protein
VHTGPFGFMHMTSDPAAELSQSVGIILAHRWLVTFREEQGEAMKYLNVQWVADTFAVFSLNICPAPGTSAHAHVDGSAPFDLMPASAAVPCTRHIVISEKGKLKADMITEQISSPGSVPELVEMS